MIFFNNPNYIEEYNNSLSKEECKIIISYFESGSKIPGMTSGGHDNSKKQCLELYNTPKFSNNSVVSNIIHTNLTKCLIKYKEKYQELNSIFCWKIDDAYNIQKYSTKDDGYKVWHCEQGRFTTSRILSWMFYLNDAKSGTEFMRYSNIKPKMGKCVIWPAAWTHFHRGIIPNNGLKYIITGWVSYDMKHPV